MIFGLKLKNDIEHTILLNERLSKAFSKSKISKIPVIFFRFAHSKVSCVVRKDSPIYLFGQKPH